MPSIVSPRIVLILIVIVLSVYQCASQEMFGFQYYRNENRSTSSNYVASIKGLPEGPVALKVWSWRPWNAMWLLLLAVGVWGAFLLSLHGVTAGALPSPGAGLCASLTNQPHGNQPHGCATARMEGYCELSHR